MLVRTGQIVGQPSAGKAARICNPKSSRNRQRMASATVTTTSDVAVEQTDAKLAPIAWEIHRITATTRMHGIRMAIIRPSLRFCIFKDLIGLGADSRCNGTRDQRL
jgi:hypothetical protein